MAAKWQQWMPFHIDRFRGSPDVRAMHPAAQMGYLYLLASAWQTDDCTISSDELDLASDSCLGDELWALYRVRIIRKFTFVEGTSRMRNDVLFGEWGEAKRIFESRVAAAKKTTEIRSPRKNNSVTVESIYSDRAPTNTVTSRSADTITLTGTLTPIPPATQAPFDSIRNGELKLTVNRVFAHYCHKLGRNINQYTLTPERRKKAELRLKERIRIRGSLSAAELEAGLCIDNLASDEFCVSGGYIDWTAQIFKSADEFEKRLNWKQKNNGGNNSNGKSTDRAYSNAADVIQEIEDSHGSNTGELLSWSGAE